MVEIAESESLESGSRKTSMYIIVGLLIVIAGVVAYFTRPNPTEEKTQGVVVASPAGVVASPLGKQAAGDVRTVNMLGDNFRFDPATITVKKGEPLKIVLTSNDMSHGIVIDELNVKSEVVTKGNSTTVEFTPDKVGEFEYYCSVGNHRAMGMVGKLIVTE